MGFRRRLDPLMIIVILAFLFLLFGWFYYIHGEVNHTKPDATPINHHLYHTWEALLEEIESLVHRHPDRLSMEKISSKNLGYEAQMNVVTYCRNHKDCDGREKLRILLNFGQHARELITTELALQLLSILSEEEFLPDVNRSTSYNSLDQLVIKIVPMENLNGRKVVENGHPCERRNGRGVDLNRNWSVDWGKKEKDYDPNEENPGSNPFSEPETQIMRKLSISFEPHIWVNVHSGMEALFMPYDHKNTTPDGKPSHVMRSILEKINHLHLKDHCLVGSGGGSVGYLAHGTATDYMYDVARIPMAFTFEIYGDLNASSNDCFKMFNPIDIATFNRVVNEWSSALLHMFIIGTQSIHELDSKLKNRSSSSDFHNWVSIDDYLNGYLIQRSSRYGKKIEVLDLGVQEIRAYFRLFMLSSVLLIFMFCSRISKNNTNRFLVGTIAGR